MKEIFLLGAQLLYSPIMSSCLSVGLLISDKTSVLKFLYCSTLLFIFLLMQCIWTISSKNYKINTYMRKNQLFFPFTASYIQLNQGQSKTRNLYSKISSLNFKTARTYDVLHFFVLVQRLFSNSRGKLYKLTFD